MRLALVRRIHRQRQGAQYPCAVAKLGRRDIGRYLIGDSGMIHVSVEHGQEMGADVWKEMVVIENHAAAEDDALGGRA